MGATGFSLLVNLSLDWEYFSNFGEKFGDLRYLLGTF